jgi:succinate dehydrogenase (ubiquinone) membrane anchor subunit
LSTEKIEGTVNDPVPIRATKPTSGSYHWTFERALAVGLVPLTAAPFIGGALSPVTDAIFSAILLIHSHIGFECVGSLIPFWMIWWLILHIEPVLLIIFPPTEYLGCTTS